MRPARENNRHTVARGMIVFLVLTSLCCGLMLCVNVDPAMAHAPHDDIFDVAPSPEYEQDKTVLTISRGFLLRSTDGGTTWQRIVRGLDNKRELYSLQVSPKDKRVLFVSSRGDGIYKSTDAGSSWSKVNRGLRSLDIRLTAISTDSSKVVLAAGARSGLFRTTDGGSTWNAVDGYAAAVGAIAFASDRAGYVLVGDQRGMLHVSKDSGETWTRAPLEGAGGITSIAISPDFSSDSTFFVGTRRRGILKTTDGGSSFDQVTDGLTDLSISSMVVSDRYATDSKVWTSTSSDGVFSSEDGGGMWTRTSRGLTTNTQNDTSGYEDRPDFGQLRAVESSKNGQAPTMFLAAFDGLFRSTDGAESWHEEQTLSSSIIVGLAVAPDHPQDPTVAMTTYLNGAHLSHDGGATWTAANKGLEEPNAYRVAPDRFARLFGINFSPNYSTDGTIFSVLSAHYLKSTTRGRSWKKVVAPGTRDNDTHTFILALSPNFGRDRTIFSGDANTGDMFRSTDGGTAFVRTGRPRAVLRCFVVSPEYPSDSTLFAGTVSGVFKSIDRGATWTPIGGQTAVKNAVTNLAISSGDQDERTILAGTPNGLFSSRDAGRSWRRVSIAGSDSGFIEAVSVSPNFSKDRTALVSVKGRGLFKSTDGGVTFHPVAKDLIEANELLGNFSRATSSAIVFSPGYATDRTVYGFSGTHLLKSTDGGESWSRLNVPTSRHEMPADSRARPSPASDDRSTSERAWVGPALIAGAVGGARLCGPRRLPGASEGSAQKLGIRVDRALTNFTAGSIDGAR